VTNPPAPRVSWVLVVVLLAALATGAAASILVSASTAPPPASGPSNLVNLPESVVGTLAAAVLLFVVAVLIYQRATSTHTLSLKRPAVVILVLIFLGILFVIVARAVGLGGPLPLSPTNNTGSGSSSGSTGNGGGNVTGPGGSLDLFPSLPAWAPFALLAVVALLVALVVVPQVRRYLVERGPREGRKPGSKGPVPSGVREALTRASSELELGGDPRLVILRLYAGLLAHLEPMVGDVGTSTPEEIRVVHLVRLGVRPAAAERLTRLFEEARYSTHPMGPKESTQAQEAVRMTLDDLGRKDFSA
jgi:hypothetical protein